MKIEKFKCYSKSCDYCIWDRYGYCKFGKIELPSIKWKGRINKGKHKGN